MQVSFILAFGTQVDIFVSDIHFLQEGDTNMDYAKESLKMHYELKGKIEVVSRAKVDSKDALSLAYHSWCCTDLALRFRRY